MRELFLTTRARHDLDAIWDHVANEFHAPTSADALIDEFDERFQQLLTFPELGEATPELRENTRRLVVRKQYLVFYEADQTRVAILRVIHGTKLISGQDLQ